MNLNQFDLNLLRALDALLTGRNVTYAARKLFVTQQAMSGSLHRLRLHFDDPLLVRVGRRMELTPLARALAEPVREALLRIQTALETKPHFDPAKARRTFRVAMSDYVAITVLPLLIRKLAAEAPNMTCHVESIGESSFERIETGDLDFNVTATNSSLWGEHAATPACRSMPLFRDDFVCVVDRNHPAVGSRMTLDLYRRLPHNVVRMGQGVVTLVEQAWRGQKLGLNIASTAPTFTALIFMLPGTPLIATAQRRLANALAPALSLRVLECPVRIDPLQENLTWHSRNETDPCSQYLRQTFRDAAAQLERPRRRTARKAVSAAANHKR